MSNQTLQAIAKVHRRISNNRNTNITFAEVLEINRVEIEFLSNKFKLKEEEALLLTASCLWVIEKCRNSSEFDVDDLASTLEVSNFEVLLQQKHLKSLVEKEYLVEFTKDCHRNCRGKSAIEILNKEFCLHSSIGEQFS